MSAQKYSPYPYSRVIQILLLIYYISSLMSLDTAMQKTIDYFGQELSGIQVGRATKWLVEHIKVDAWYGLSPIGQLGNITLPDNQTIKIEPWDKSTLSPMEKAIYESASWLSPQNQWWYLLMKVPALTSERREQIKKQISKMAEDCKARLRQARQDELKSIKREFEEKIISEDDKKFAEKQVDETTKTYTDKIDVMTKAKHEDIMTI